MRNRIATLVLCSGFALACRTGGEQPNPQPVAAPAVPSRADRLAAITTEQESATNAYYAAVTQALGENKNPSADEWNKAVLQVKQEGKFAEPNVQLYLPRVRQLVDEDATDATAFHAVAWLIDNAGSPQERKELVALLEQRHMLGSPEMESLCSRLGSVAPELVAQLAADSPHPAVRGQASYAMAESLKRDIQMSERVKSSDTQGLEGLKNYLGAEKVAALQTLDADATRKQIEELYERVCKDYADVVVNKGTKRESTLGKQAIAALHELRDLALGRPAPEIAGADLDRVAFKLSDYRGKVVLLDFWGNW
jgi:hypothetical protein